MKLVVVASQRDDLVVVPLPRDCSPLLGLGGFAGSPFFVRYMFKIGFCCEGVSFAMGDAALRRCSRRPPITFVCWAIGNRPNSRCCHRNKSHIPHFEPRLGMLGWVEFWTQSFSGVTMIERNSRNRCVFCAMGRRQVSELTESIVDVSFTLRPDHLFVGADVGCGRVAAGRVFPPGP